MQRTRQQLQVARHTEPLEKELEGTRCWAKQALPAHTAQLHKARPRIEPARLDRRSSILRPHTMTASERKAFRNPIRNGVPFSEATDLDGEAYGGGGRCYGDWHSDGDDEMVRSDD